MHYEIANCITVLHRTVLSFMDGGSTVIPPIDVGVT